MSYGVYCHLGPLGQGHVCEICPCYSASIFNGHVSVGTIIFQPKEQWVPGTTTDSKAEGGGLQGELQDLVVPECEVPTASESMQGEVLMSQSIAVFSLGPRKYCAHAVESAAMFKRCSLK